MNDETKPNDQTDAAGGAPTSDEIKEARETRRAPARAAANVTAKAWDKAKRPGGGKYRSAQHYAFMQRADQA